LHLVTYVYGIISHHLYATNHLPLAETVSIVYHHIKLQTQSDENGTSV